MNEVEVIKYQNAVHVPVAFDGRIMYVSAKVELIHVSLKAGEIIEKHPNPMDVVFYVIAGKGNITVEDSDYSVDKNTTIFVPARLKREWKNTGKTNLRILVLKTLI